MATIKIKYNGKEIEREVVVDGVVKFGEAFLVRCNETNEWCYCSKDRLDKFTAKFGSLEKVGTGHLSREGKKARKTRDGVIS